MKAKTRVKSVLMLSLLLSLFAFTVKPVLAQQEAFLTAPTIENPLMAPGDTFFIDVLIDDVTDLWSFNFTLSYDTSILTATSYSIYTSDPVGGNGFRNFFPTNEINDNAGYVRVGADRGPSGLITSELLGTSDGINKVYTVSNPRIGDRDGDGLVNQNDVTIYYDGIEQIPNPIQTLSALIGRITLFTAPAEGTVITVDYVHPGLTRVDPFNLVKVNFSIDSRGITALDLQNLQIVDVSMNPIITTEIDGSFDNRFHGHLAVPDYVNGDLLPGDEFDIVITADNVRTSTWGVSFWLDYDTNVLTAETGIVNDAAGNTYIQLTGLSLLTVDSVPLVTITFMLDAGGWSPLHFRDVTAVSIYGDALSFDSTDGSFSDVHDVAVTNVVTSATLVEQGDSLTINATVANQGNFTETFDVTAFYNTTAIVPSQTVNLLASGTSTTLTFNWDTTGVAPSNYTIKAQASAHPTESDTSDNSFTDGTVKIFLGPIISILPTSGPAGTKVQVTGLRFGALEHVVVSFDDTVMSEVDADAQGAFTVVLNVPLSETGTHTIKAASPTILETATFNVIDMSQVDVTVEVGTIHFRGELAEFYIQTAFKGKPTDTTSITATLRKPDGTTQALTTSQVATGLYKAPYTILTNAPTGTYLLIVEAEYITGTIESKGTSIRSFLLSPTLTGWNAVLLNINGTVATIKTDVGLIKVGLNTINATLTNLDQTIGTIDTAIGEIQTDIDTIHTQVTGINGTLVNVETDVGTILGRILAVQSDVVTIKTDIGTIKTTIQGWTGATISDVVTPTGTFNLLTLTTSKLENLAFSDNTITIVVSGTTGTSGKTNIVIPKQFLTEIGSDIDQVEATLNDKQVDFTFTEDTETYVLSLGYTHSTHTIKMFLTGIPPQPPLPLATILMILVAILATTSALLFYFRRTRKKAVRV